MSNYIEYKNVIAFHPGYYVKETIEEYGITQEDFAKRLNTKITRFHPTRFFRLTLP